MTKKKFTDEASELQQDLEQAELAGQQAEEQALIQAAEAAEVTGYTEDRDLMNQLIGQVQMSRSIAKFADVISLTKAAHIKKTKLYRTLAGKKAVDPEGNEIADVGTWEGFCQLIGTTRSKMDEDLRNLSEFGEEALENLNRVGAGYRELRKLRKLPEEEREMIINGEAVKAGDKETLIELIEEMAARHAKEKEALEKKQKNLEGDLEGARRMAANKSERIAKLETEIHRKSALEPDERAAELSAQLDKAVLSAKSALLAPRGVIGEILDWEEAPRDLKHGCAQAIARLHIALDEIQADYHLSPVDLDVDDSWTGEAE